MPPLKDPLIVSLPREFRGGLVPGSVRVTPGAARYVLPWYRRVLVRVISRSHLKTHSYPG